MLDSIHDSDQDVLCRTSAENDKRRDGKNGRQGMASSHHRFPRDFLAAHIVTKILSQKNLSETAIHALLYTKFYNTSADLRILLFELEKRGQLEPLEYGSLLQECYTAWFTCRWTLLGAPLAEEVRRMEPSTTDLIKLVSFSVPFTSSLDGVSDVV